MLFKLNNSCETMGPRPGVDTCGVPDEWVADASSSDPATRYNFTGFRAASTAHMTSKLT